MAIHRVLIQRNQEIDTVAHVRHLFRAGTNGEKGMPTANDGLVGIVGIQVQPTAAEYFRENIAWRRYSCPAAPPIPMAKVWLMTFLPCIYAGTTCHGICVNADDRL